MIRASLLASLCLLLALSASAREAVVGMSGRVLEDINEIHDAIDQEQYDTAWSQLEDLLGGRLSGYERAHALNLKGVLLFEQDDLAGAREAYTEALEQPRIPDSQVGNFLQTLARLGLLQSDYDYAKAQLTRLLAMPDFNTPANRVLLANVYLGAEDYASARDLLQDILAETRAAGDQPRENWLSMLASAHFQLEEYAAMREVTRELVSLYPRERHLMNLAALHGQMGDTGRQLALVEGLLDEGRLKQESHLRMVASLFIAEELPYKAAKLLQREIDNGRVEATERTLEQLSQAWFLADEAERAIPPLERAAALSENGDLYMRVARLYMDVYQWEAAEKAARAALEKGGLRAEGGAWLVRGMALVRMEKFTQAEDFFDRASKFEDTRAYAEQWMAFADSERERLAATQVGS